MKRVFGMAEAIFDILYLTVASILGFTLLFSEPGNTVGMLAGVMALVLVGGDAFHLVPRIIVIKTGREERYRNMLGRGKQIASITMTLFYVFLWQIALQVFIPNDNKLWSYIIYILSAVRIFMCLLPQNKWMQRYPPVNWGIWRNIPFFLQGMTVAGLFFSFRSTIEGLSMMWLAIILSFAFYLPVVLWANKNPKVGMLMLPKTCTYIWMLIMCLSL